MSAQYQWSPLVFGRTFSVDFRLLAVPQGTNRDDTEWFLEHIAGTTVDTEDLRAHNRWSIFKNDRFCAFGLTCMSALVSGIKVVADDRDLYLFAGWAAPIDKTLFPDSPHHPPIPPLSVIDRPPYWAFRTLYDFVDLLWDDERTSINEIREDIERPAQNVFHLKKILARNSALVNKLNEAVAAGNGSLNYDSTKLAVFPVGSADHNEQSDLLWVEAVQSEQSVSLCVGLPDESMALEGPFLNTVLQYTQTAELIDLSSDRASHAHRRPVNPVPPAPHSRSTHAVGATADSHSSTLPVRRFFEIMHDAAEASPDKVGDWIVYD